MTVFSNHASCLALHGSSVPNAETARYDVRAVPKPFSAHATLANGRISQRRFFIVLPDDLCHQIKPIDQMKSNKDPKDRTVAERPLIFEFDRILLAYRALSFLG